jgi:hypothetical protein
LSETWVIRSPAFAGLFSLKVRVTTGQKIARVSFIIRRLGSSFLFTVKNSLQENLGFSEYLVSADTPFVLSQEVSADIFALKEMRYSASGIFVQN